MFRYAINDLRVLVENPADSIKRREVRAAERIIPSKEDFSRLVAELRKDHRSTGEAAVFVEFLAYSGMRKAEAVTVRWSDCNGAFGAVTVTGGESGAENHQHRVVPLFPPLNRLLDDMRERKKPTSDAGGIFSIGDARLQIHRACERLGLPPYGHHSMRNFFCSNCIEAGVDFSRS